MKFEDDEDEKREEMLRKLSGDVEDFAGKSLPESGAKGVSITITVSPGGEVSKEKELEDTEEMTGKDLDKDNEEGEPHDPIAHILGMCGGGCTK